jgi:hypothetical protein
MSDDPPRDTPKETPLEAHIRELVDAAPPLTPDQRDRLAILLRGDRKL